MAAAPEPYTAEQFRSDLATLGIPFGEDFDADLPNAMHRLKARHSHPDRPGGSTEAMQRLNLAKERVEAWIARGRLRMISAEPPVRPAPPPRQPRSPGEEREDAAEAARQSAAELRRRRQKQSPEEMRQEAAASFEQAREQLRRTRTDGPKAKPTAPPPSPVPAGLLRRIPGPLLIVGLAGLALSAILLIAQGYTAVLIVAALILFAFWLAAQPARRR